MTAHSVIRTFTPAEQAATELSLRLHALWKALEAVPLPRLAAWAVPISWRPVVRTAAAKTRRPKRRLSARRPPLSL